MALFKQIKIATQIAKMQIMERMDVLYIFVGIIIGILAQMVLTIIFFKAIYAHVDAIGGWEIEQVYILLGLYFIIENVAWASYFRGFQRLPYMIENGELDRLMAWPVNIRHLLMYRYIDVLFIWPQLLAGLGMIIYGAQQMGTALSIPTFLLLIACAFIIHYSLMLALLSINFLRLTHSLSSMAHELQKLGQYPAAIYRGVARLVLSVVIPVTVIFSVPVRALVGQISQKEIIATLLIAAIIYLVSVSFWKFCLNRYKSAMG